MKLTNFHLIIILALALILCPVLGVCRNTREGLGMDSRPKEKKREMMEDGEGSGDYNDPNFAPGQ